MESEEADKGDIVPQQPWCRGEYMPRHLSEIQDELSYHIGKAPSYRDPDEEFFGENIHTHFARLIKAFGLVRDKVGEERYARLVVMAEQAKALFLEDPEEINGKTDQGIDLIWAIDTLLEEGRDERYAAGLPDVDGRVTGD